MATSRDELREELVAAIEAAPELDKEDRQHLADVFLDGLTARYQLIPRGSPSNQSGERSRSRSAGWGVGSVPFALILFIALVALPATAGHHFPVIPLLIVGLFVAARRHWWTARRGRTF